jgi:hypothetical protein
VFEGGALAARGGFWSRNEKRGHVLACDDVRRLNRNMASLKADFLLKKQVRLLPTALHDTGKMHCTSNC